MGRRAWRLGIVLGTVFGVWACGGGGGSEGSPGDDPPTTLTVSGTVVKQEAYGSATQPDVGATVVVIGQGEAVTDGAGRFTVPDVTPPYDVLVLDDTKESLAIHYGLTRADPVLRGTEPDGAPLRGSGAAGHVTGGVGWPAPAGTTTAVAWGNADRPSTGQTIPSETDGAYDLILSWVGESTIPVGGVALQWQRGLEGPTSYSGFGARSGNATDGVPMPDVDIALAPIDADTVTGTLAIPDGYGTAGLSIVPVFDSHAMLSVFCGTWESEPFSVLVPDLPNAALWMQLVGRAPSRTYLYARRAVRPGDAGVALQLPEAIDSLVPPDGATGVTHETTFAVTEVPDGVVRVRYAPTGGSDGPVVWVTAASGSWQIPDLSTYDVLILPGSQYAWRTWGYGPATVDDLCDPTPFTERSPHWETRSVFFEFTTGP